jgi:hypothetical protein
MIGHSMHDPLANVSAQMQDEIADSVFMRRLALPDLLFTQPAEASLYAPGHLSQFARRIIKKKLCYHGLHNMDFLSDLASV